MEAKGIFSLWAGVLGFAGVALGAFGAHALKDTLESAGSLEHWRTAVFYQLIHAVALLAWDGRRDLPRAAGWCLVAGVILFSGSLYCLSLGILRPVMGPITPLGGVALLTGWAWMTVSVWRGFRFRKADALRRVL